MPKPIIISKRLFKRGAAKCMVCDKRFRYFLPIDVLPVWDRLCAAHNDLMPVDAPGKGEIVLEISEWA